MHLLNLADKIVFRVRMPMTVVLKLFRAVAHFKGPQIFVAHFHKNFDVMTTMPLR